VNTQESMKTNRTRKVSLIWEGEKNTEQKIRSVRGEEEAASVGGGSLRLPVPERRVSSKKGEVGSTGEKRE